LKILGISGSLRAGSYNTKLLRAASELLPPDVDFELWDGLKAVPPYDEDDDVQPAPAGVAALRQAIIHADAVLFATPEYNWSVPGVLKNAIDWASRPAVGSPLAGKPVALMGASTGMGGTRSAQEQLRQVLAFPRARVLEEHVHVPQAYARFDTEGNLTDAGTRGAVRALLATLAVEGAPQEVPELALLAS
jgi:chromate reductase, NAD(P)H dehydrogenase (quinone)